MPLWGGASQTMINRAQIVLNVAARWVTGLGKRTRVKDLMIAAGWLSIMEQIRTTTAISIWKTVHLHKPARMMQKLVCNQDLTLSLPPPRLISTRSCYKWRAVDLWNSLDPDLRNERSISRFKKRIKLQVLEERNQDPRD